MLYWQYGKSERIKAAYPPMIGGATPPDIMPYGYERKEGKLMITYPDLIQFCMFIIALVGLCYTIFKGKK